MLERHFHQYVTKHLNEYHPLSNKQWGFQSGKSTVTALLSVTHDWFQALEAGQEVCSTFFDLRKAFDSVPHWPLVDKLANLGLDAHALSWITSYLTNQKQRVVVGGKSSLDTPVLSGVPQGSAISCLHWWCFWCSPIRRKHTQPLCRWHATVQACKINWRHSPPANGHW